MPPAPKKRKAELEVESDLDLPPSSSQIAPSSPAWTRQQLPKEDVPGQRKEVEADEEEDDEDLVEVDEVDESDAEGKKAATEYEDLSDASRRVHTANRQRSLLTCPQTFFLAGTVRTYPYPAEGLGSTQPPSAEKLGRSRYPT